MSEIQNSLKQNISAGTAALTRTEDSIGLKIDKSRGLFYIAKRLFDIIVSLSVLCLIFPLILLSGLAIKLTSSGPIFYRAKRAGLGGKSFEMFKLRTMVVGRDAVDRRVTEAHDDRITRVGKWLRKLKLDELPQFWNVLVGDMSIVGPRPEDWDIVQHYYTPEQWETLKVRPGIASLAEVRWYPDLTYHDPPPPGVPIQEWYIQRHMPAQLAESLRYVEQQSLWLDLKIIFHTAFCILVYSWLPPEKQPLPEQQQEAL
jgi:lipopolysaccharide/colanic/teichoic acid biosynthesis glycosyltransferase